jgi:hypothetical protein
MSATRRLATTIADIIECGIPLRNAIRAEIGLEPLLDPSHSQAAVEPPPSPQAGAAAAQTGARRRRSTPRPAATAEVR